MPTPDSQWPEIYKFAKDDPVEGGPDGIDNLPLKQLETRTETLRAGQRQQDISIAKVHSHVTHWTEKLEKSPSEGLGFLLEAQISGAGTLVEHFIQDWTLIDTGPTPQPIALTDGRVPVVGDDSLDLVSTKALVAGESYLLFDSAGFRQLVTVSQILDPGRVRIASILPRTLVFPAWVGRTDWQCLPTGGALAQKGGIYRSRTINLGPSGKEPKILLLRQEGEAEITLEGQAAQSNPISDEWQARLAARRWEVQTQEIEREGKRWLTDAPSRAALAESLALAFEWKKAHPGKTWQTAWKNPDGFVTVTRAELLAIAFAMGEHIQGAFQREANLLQQIREAGFETLAPLSEEIEETW